MNGNERGPYPTGPKNGRINSMAREKNNLTATFCFDAFEDALVFVVKKQKRSSYF